MLLTYESRHVGDIRVVTCRGSIAEGTALAALQQYVDDSLRETPYIVADVGAVDFIDSCGVGFLVRLHTKAQRAGGGLKLCALPARIAEVLRVTHVATIFAIYGTQAEAIAACYELLRRQIRWLASSPTFYASMDRRTCSRTCESSSRALDSGF
jgi:anti-sigma B factor antagonist